MDEQKDSPKNILNSTFLKMGKEAFEKEDYATAEEEYRKGMEYAWEHEKEVGIYWIFRSINSVGAALAAQGNIEGAKAMYKEAEAFLYSKVNDELRGHIIDLFDIADFLSKDNMDKIELVNPYTCMKAGAMIMEDITDEDIKKGYEHTERDPVVGKIRKPDDEEIASVLSSVPADDLTDIAHALYDIAYNEEGSVCKTIDESRSYYELLLKFPLPPELHGKFCKKLENLSFLCWAKSMHERSRWS